MCSQTQKSVSADLIFELYQQWASSSNDLAALMYAQLREVAIKEQDALYELTFSGKLNYYQIIDILHLGFRETSEKQDNLDWIPFLTRVRDRLEELPSYIKCFFAWLERKHYWDKS